MLDPHPKKLMCWKNQKLHILTTQGLQPYTAVKGHIPNEAMPKMSKGFRTMQVFLKQGFTLVPQEEITQYFHRL